MKNIAIILIMLTMPIIAMGMMFQKPPRPITIEGRLNYPVISENGGTVFLQLTLSTQRIGTSGRKPMNLAIVVDRSGSMGDQQKLRYVKEAFRNVIQQLRPSDILSVVIYDDRVDVLRRSQKVGRDKNSLWRIIDEIEPGGSTNLGGGLMEGLEQVETYASHNYINRVILLSDGLANVGITNPMELNRIARRYRQRSIAVTTMGVGLDYNENLMMGLAESGGGNYYFIEHPKSLASIIEKEMNMMSSVFAQNAVITIKPGRHVRIDDIIGCEYERTENGISIPIGDLYSNDYRELTIPLHIPEGSGILNVLEGEIHYSENEQQMQSSEFAATIRYSKNRTEIETNRDLDAQAKADVAVSTLKVEQAMNAMDKGDQSAAEMHLSEAKSLLQSSPASSISGASGDFIRDQISRTESYRQVLKDSADARKVKKSIQYDNYQIQKRK